MKSILAILGIFTCLLVNAQTISTFAGNGMIGNTGDGGPATAAKINYPGGGIFDKHSNYYFVLGLSGNRVRKVSPDGIIHTVAGTGAQGFFGDGGLAITALLNNPQAVTVDSIGNLYIADAANQRIRRVDIATGIISTIAGTGIAGYNGDGILAMNAMLSDPVDLCFDKKGNLYIADAANARVRKISPNGIITTFAGNGIPVYNGDGGLADTSGITNVQGVCSDDTGNIYLADNLRLHKVDTFGIMTTISGNGTDPSDSIPAIGAQIAAEKVAFRKGNIFICSYSDNRVRMIDTSGIIKTIAGTGVGGYNGDGGLADTSEINYPCGLSLDSCDNLYIAEGHNYRIRKINFSPDCNIVDTADTTTSIRNVEMQNSLRVYPNPAREQITLAGGSNRKDVMIQNVMGQVMIQQTCLSYNANVSVDGLKTGLYYISVKDKKSGKTVRMKFLKE